MTETEVRQYIMDTFPDVETSENFGYKFFFYRSDHKLPFATLATTDSDYDRVSNLGRPGVYRLNIGVGKPTFQSLFGPDRIDVHKYDYTALDRFMPHPDYYAQNWVCVLSPGEETFLRVQAFLAEAYEIARTRFERHAQVE